MDDTIGKLLRAGLLTSLGEDQDRAPRLRTASKHLRDGFLSDTRADIPSALLAAVDEDGPSDVPVLTAARAAIVDQWEMFENAYVQQDPSSILRAVTLDAVVAATESDPQVEAAAWYTLRDVAQVVSVGRWAQPIKDILNDLDARVSPRINEAWAPIARGSSLKMPSVSAAGKTEPVKIAGLEEFLAELEQQGADFALRENFPDLIENLSKAVTHRTDTAETKRLKNVVQALGERLREVLAAHESLLMATARRDTLLWWRLGGRSNRLGTRYHEAPDTATAVVAAAFDLHDLASDVAPVAVEDLLIDVLHEARLSEEQVTIEAMAEACGQLQLSPSIEASPPFLIVDVVVGGLDTNGLVCALRGPMPAQAAATTLFRNLQTRRLLADKSREDGPGD